MQSKLAQNNIAVMVLFTLIPGIIFITLSVAIFNTNASHNFFLIAAFVAAMIFSVFAENIFWAFTKPNKYFFRFRFFIEGLLKGLLLGLVTLPINLILHETYDPTELAIYFLIFSLFGIIIYTSSSFWRYIRIKRKLLRIIKIDNILCCDVVKSFNYKHRTHSGLLMIADKQLLFYSSKKDEIIYREKLANLHLGVLKSKYFNIPQGLSISGEENTKIRVKFPFFWMKRVKS